MKTISSKGSKISETKNKINQEKLVDMAKDNNMITASNSLKIASHRNKKHISFEEYKTLILEGKSSDEIIKTTSKHLIYFYNAILKGKITLTKENFINMYDSGLSLEEIAIKENMPREHITFLRDMYGVKRKGAKFINRKKNEKDLSKEAQDLIIASLLGDGGINPWGYFFETHSEKQISYLEWKAQYLRDLWGIKPFSAAKDIDKRSNQTIYSFRFRANTHSFTKKLREDFYPNNVKIIPNYVYDNLNEFQLAVWFMDDGSTDWSTRASINTNPCCKISSQSFTLEENHLLQKTLNDRWNITPQIKFRLNKKGLQIPYLQFNTKATELLFNIIKPYIHKDLSYKINKDQYLLHKAKKWEKEKLITQFIDKHNLKANQYGNRWS